MAIRPLQDMLGNLRAATLLEQVRALTDAELLDAFIARKDALAFETLVRRHGPMVLGVCRRILRNPDDAEDAMQATFLVLVRKAASVRPRCQVGNWLYGVAYRTALRANALAVLRRTREKQVSVFPEPQTEPREGLDDVRAALHQELSRLPDKYRSVLVLCDLQGKTYKEAAHQLGCPLGTVSTCLTRGRALLAKRLTRQGLTLSAGAMGVFLTQQTAPAGLPQRLIADTTHAAAVLLLAEGSKAGISTSVLALADGVTKTMWLTKQKICLAALVIGVCVGGGFLWDGPSMHAEQQAEVRPEAAPVQKLATADQAGADAGKLQETLLALEKESLDALKKPDIDVAKTMTAPDFIGILSDGSRLNRDDYLQALQTYRLKSYTMKDVRLVQLTPDAASLTYRIKSDYTILGIPLTDDLSVSSTWVRRNGKWCNVLYQETEIER